MKSKFEPIKHIVFSKSAIRAATVFGIGLICVLSAACADREITSDEKTVSQALASTAFEIDYYTDSDFTQDPVGTYINDCGHISRSGRTTRFFVRQGWDACDRGSGLGGANCVVDGLATTCSGTVCNLGGCCEFHEVIHVDGTVSQGCW